MKRKNKSFAAALKRWRMKWGDTQAQAADALGVKLDTYRTWERGRSEPRGPEYQRILEII